MTVKYSSLQTVHQIEPILNKKNKSISQFVTFHQDSETSQNKEGKIATSAEDIVAHKTEIILGKDNATS